MGKILQELRAAGAALTCSGLGQDTGFAHGREEIQIPNIPKSWILQGLCFREFPARDGSAGKCQWTVRDGPDQVSQINQDWAGTLRRALGPPMPPLQIHEALWDLSPRSCASAAAPAAQSRECPYITPA